MEAWGGVTDDPVENRRRWLARKLANAASLEYIQREFRTNGVTMTWSTDRGWEFSVSAINYLDIRDSINATTAAT